MSQQNPWDFSEYSESAGSAGPGQGRPGQPQQGQPGLFGPGAPNQGLPGQGMPQPGFAPDAGGSPFGVMATPGTANSAPTLFGPSLDLPQQLATSKAPAQWLLVAIGLAVVAVVVALVLGGMPPLAIAAWVLAGPLGIGMLAFFTTSDLKARAGAVYLAQPWVRPLYWVALVLCLAGAMVAAWKIAEWVGRL